MLPKRFQPVTILSLCYMTAYISYSCVSNLTLTLYMQVGLEKLALISLIMVYIGFGPGNFITIPVIKKFGLKNSLLLGFYGLFIAEFSTMIILVTYSQGIKKSSYYAIFIYLLGISKALIEGLAGSLVWIVNPTYISAACEGQNVNSQNKSKQELMVKSMGKFWSIHVWCAVISNSLALLLLNVGSNFIFLVSMNIIGFLGCIIVKVFLQDFPLKKISRQQQSIKSYSLMESTIDQVEQSNMISQRKSFMDVIKLLKQGLYSQKRWLFFYSTGTSFSLSCYMLVLTLMISSTLRTDQSKQPLKYLIPISFILQGIIQIITGLFLNINSHLFKNKQKMLLYGVIGITGCFVFIPIGIFINQYWICLVNMVVWSVFEVHVKTMIDAYIRAAYKQNQIQYYGINILFWSIGAALSLAVFTALQQNIALIIIFVVGFSLSLLSSIKILQAKKK